MYTRNQYSWFWPRTVIGVRSLNKMKAFWICLSRDFCLAESVGLPACLCLPSFLPSFLPACLWDAALWISKSISTHRAIFVENILRTRNRVTVLVRSPVINEHCTHLTKVEDKEPSCWQYHINILAKFVCMGALWVREWGLNVFGVCRIPRHRQYALFL